VTSKRIFIFIGVSMVILALAPFFGAEPLVWNELNDALSASHRIFFGLRLSRLAITLFVGGTLAILGATYQVLFQNPLAEPYLLGVSSAVMLGMIVGETIFHCPPGVFANSIFGWIGGLGVTALLILSYVFRRGPQLERLILFGLGINFVLSSLLFLLLSYHYQQMGGGTFRFLFGQIPWANSSDLKLILFLGLPLTAIIFLMGRHLDALSLGDSVAKTLGFSPTHSRIWLLAVTSTLVALVTSLTGAIGFVGLVVPHGIRLLCAPSTNRVTLLLSFIAGAAFLTFADVISRVLMPPFEFPIGIVTTLIGGPIFLGLLWKK
jgi:iron complex transport system permease protein